MDMLTPTSICTHGHAYTHKYMYTWTCLDTHMRAHKHIQTHIHYTPGPKMKPSACILANKDIAVFLSVSMVAAAM